MASFIPYRESELVTWSTNFAAVLTAAPADYGATAEQAAAFTALQQAFVAAHQTANDPATRSPTNIQLKSQARRAMVESARELAAIAQATPGMTNAKRSALGVSLRDPDPTPVPPPTTSPLLEIASVVGWAVTVRLRNAEGSGRRKPDGVKGANVFSYVGDTPPNDVEAWKFEGGTTKTETVVEFPTTLPPGTKVWITAFWFNPTLQSGPACPPVSTQINYGGLAQVA